MTVLVSDTFTAANGTALNGRTPDTTVSSRTWTVGNVAAMSVTDPNDIQNNRARHTTTDNGILIDSGQSDYVLTFDLFTPGSGNYRGGCIFRAQNAFPYSAVADCDFYWVVVRADLNNVRILKSVNGTQTDIASSPYAFTFATNTTYNAELTLSGSAITFKLNGSSVFSITDTTYTTGTIFGFAKGAGTVDFIYDNVSLSVTSSTVVRRTDSDRSGSRN